QVVAHPYVLAALTGKKKRRLGHVVRSRDQVVAVASSSRSTATSEPSYAHRTYDAPHVKPPPKAASTRLSPGRNSDSQSERQRGIVAAVVFPWRSMLNITLSSPMPMRRAVASMMRWFARSEEHTSELQSRENLVCRLLLEKKK